MTAGFFSPLPPARTGVADYAAALLRGLRQNGRVEVNAERAGINLYNLGNNQLHRTIYERALRVPGVVVIHDAVLHHFFLGSMTEGDYIQEFAYNYGAWSEGLARSLWRDRARSASDPRYFRFPMLRRICEASRSVVVHNAAAAAMVRQHAPAARVYEIPHLWDEVALPAQYDVERLRARFQGGTRKLVCGVFGHLRESKRLTRVLEATESLRRSGRLHLVVAGEFASKDLERAVEPLLQAESITRVGYLSESDFWLYASAVDVCLNLKYPAAGETSGIAIRFMGLGKPVMFTEGREVSGYPEGSCIRVSAGEPEKDLLAAYFEWSIENRAKLAEIGRRAAAYIRTAHGLEAVSRAYWKALTDCYDGV